MGGSSQINTGFHRTNFSSKQRGRLMTSNFQKKVPKLGPFHRNTEKRPWKLDFWNTNKTVETPQNTCGGCRTLPTKWQNRYEIFQKKLTNCQVALDGARNELTQLTDEMERLTAANDKNSDSLGGRFTSVSWPQ
jgi:hypothetical protein